MITVQSRHDGFSIPAISRGARTDVPRGGVVIIQEIFGLTDHIASMCGAFAADGYDVLAPSLFDRIEANFHAAHDDAGIAKGRAAVMATPWGQIAADIQSAIDASPRPCYVAGFCWGGAAAWAAAARCEGLAAAASFYGRMIPDIEDQPRAPIMLHYGARDASIPPENIESVRARAPLSPLYMYDAGHGFCREGSADFDKAARDLAMRRTLDWFARWR